MSHVLCRGMCDRSFFFFLSFIISLQQRFNGVGTQFQMFDSTAYDAQNLLFKDSTTELVAITDQNYQAWLGDDYLHAMQALSCDPNSRLSLDSYS